MAEPKESQVLEGDLASVGLPQVLKSLAARQATGILTVQGEEDIVAVSCLGGHIVTADSLNQTHEESLGDLLVNQNLVVKGDFDAVVMEHQGSGGSLGDLLVSRGLITREKLLECLRLQTYRLMLQVLTWRRGEFKFYGGDEVSYEKGVTPISVEELLIRALAELGEKSGVGGDVPRLDAIYRRVPPRGAVQVVGKQGFGDGPGIWITEAQQAFLEHMDGRLSAYDIARSLGAGRFKTLFSLHQLIQHDLIELVQVARPRSTPAEAPRPQAPPTAPTPVPGVPGSGAPGSGAPGLGAPGSGAPGLGAPGLAPGSGAPGSRPAGRGAPGRGAPGRGAPGRGAPGLGTPGLGAGGAVAAPPPAPGTGRISLTPPPSPAVRDEPQTGPLPGVELPGRREPARPSPSSEDVSVSAEPATPRPWIGPVLALFLAAATVFCLVTRPGAFLLPFPWQSAQRSAVERQMRQTLFYKIDRAVATYYLMEFKYPDTLLQLVDRELLSSSDLSTPTGQRLRFSSSDEAYRIELLEDEETVESRAGTVKRDFVADQDYFPPEDVRNPLVLLD